MPTTTTTDEGLATSISDSTMARDFNAVARDISQYIIKISKPPNNTVISQRVFSIFQTIDGFLNKPTIIELKRAQTQTANALEKYEQNSALDIQILEQIKVYLDEMEAIIRSMKLVLDKQDISNEDQTLRDRIKALSLNSTSFVQPNNQPTFGTQHPIVNSTPLRETTKAPLFKTIAEEDKKVAGSHDDP